MYNKNLPEEQFKNAVKNYKPSSRYNGITKFPIFMFGENETFEEKFQQLIQWCDSINETEFANYLREMRNAYEDIQFELDYQISEYESASTNKDVEKAAHKINALCHVLKKSAGEYLVEQDIDFERERLLGIY